MNSVLSMLSFRKRKNNEDIAARHAGILGGKQHLGLEVNECHQHRGGIGTHGNLSCPRANV